LKKTQKTQKWEMNFMRFGRGRLRIAVRVGLAVLVLAVLADALSLSWEPRKLPADLTYNSLPNP
jgi:hypothetical protein